MIVTIDLKCRGYGASYIKTINLTKDDLEELAVQKMREQDSSTNIDPINIKFCDED